MIRMRRFARSTRAAVAVEYGLIVSLIVLAMLGALRQVAGKTNVMWNTISNAATAVMGGP